MVDAHVFPEAQGRLTRRTAVIGGGALLVSVPTPANAGADDRALLAACERLQAMCRTPLPADDAEAEQAIEARFDLFDTEIRCRRAETLAGSQAQVLAWLSLRGGTSEGADDLAAMFGTPPTAD